jgi:hypothetical protein
MIKGRPRLRALLGPSSSTQEPTKRAHTALDRAKFLSLHLVCKL